MVQHLHSLHVEKELLEYQLDGVKEALSERKKLANKQKVLLLYAHTLKWHGGARWWSPRSKKEADARDAAYEAYAAEQEAAKATERELKKTQSCLRISVMSRHVCGVQERRKRGIKGGLRSAKQLTNARQKESARSKLATLKKLYKSMQKASVRLQQLQSQLQSVLVVLDVPGIPLLFMRSLSSRPPTSTLAAAKY